MIALKYSLEIDSIDQLIKTLKTQLFIRKELWEQSHIRNHDKAQDFTQYQLFQLK